MTRYTLNVTHRNGGHESSGFVSRPVMPTKSQLATATSDSSSASASVGSSNHPPSATGSKQSQQRQGGAAAGRKSKASKLHQPRHGKPSSPSKTTVPDSAIASAVSSPVSASLVPQPPPSASTTAAAASGGETGGQSASEAGGASGEQKGKGKGKGKQQQRNSKKRPNPDNEDDAATKSKRPRPDRKQAKKDKKKKSQICFSCRQPGHSIKECTSVSSSNPSSPTKSSPSFANVDLSKVKCYLCGASKHTLKDCPARFKAPRDETSGKVILPYATCFHCNETGHLAGQCPKNEKGMYLNGGCCHICGSVQHLARDCKPSKVEEEMATMVGTVTADQSADADDVFVALHNMDMAKSAKKAAADAASAAGTATVVSRKGVKKVVF